MTRATLLHVLERPTALGPEEVRELEQLAQAFPYCQTAHLLLAKAAHDQGTMLAGQRLRRAATYAADRSLLRRLIEQVEPQPEPQLASVSPRNLVDRAGEFVPLAPAQPASPAHAVVEAAPSQAAPAPAAEPDRAAVAASPPALAETPAAFVATVSAVAEPAPTVLQLAAAPRPEAYVAVAPLIASLIQLAPIEVPVATPEAEPSFTTTAAFPPTLPLAAETAVAVATDAAVLPQLPRQSAVVGASPMLAAAAATLAAPAAEPTVETGVAPAAELAPPVTAAPAAEDAALAMVAAVAAAVPEATAAARAAELVILAPTAAATPAAVDALAAPAAIVALPAREPVSIEQPLAAAAEPDAESNLAPVKPEAAVADPTVAASAVAEVALPLPAAVAPASLALLPVEPAPFSNSDLSIGAGTDLSTGTSTTLAAEPELPAQAPAIRPPVEAGAARFEYGLAEPTPQPAGPLYELPGLVDEWASAAVTLSLGGPKLLATAPVAASPVFTPAAFTGDAAVGYAYGESSRLGLAMQLLDVLTAKAEAAEATTAVVAAAQPAATPLPPTGTFFEPDPLLLDHWATHRPVVPELPSPLDLINNFLRRQPRLTRAAMLPPAATHQADLSVRSTRAEPDLVSENLARIFVRQGKTARAIEIYEKLMVKQPEKLAYFAAQIQSLQPSA